MANSGRLCSKSQWARYVLLAAVVGWQSAWAATVGLTTVAPSTASVGVATNLLVTSIITDPSLVAGSVNLQQLDANGQVIAVLGTLHDDGLNGDAIANDGAYSFQTTLYETAPAQIKYRVSASFKGSLLRSFSPPIVVNVAGTAVNVSIQTPANLTYTNTSPVNVVGRVGDPHALVKINGINAPVTGGQFMATVPLVEGLNTLTAVASNTGGSALTASVQTTLDTTPPHLTIDSPSDGITTTASSVTVTGIANDVVVGTVNAGDVQVVVNGIPAVVANRTYSAASVPLAVGPNTIQAVGRDRAGNGTTITSTVVRTLPSQPPSPKIGAAVITNSLALVSGNNQSASIGAPLSAPLVVQLSNSAGQPVANQPVVFAVIGNNGFVGPSGSPGAASAVVNTDGSGKAQVSWTLGQRAGAGINSVQVSSVLAVGPVVFTATGTASQAARVNIDSGNNQSGQLGEPLTFPLVAVVTDSGHNRVANVPVTFNVTQGGGSMNGLPSQTVQSDSNGRAIAVLTLGSQPGNDNNVIQANFPGNPGLAVAFSASAVAPGDPAATSISGVVLDNSNNPLTAVTMRLFQTNQGSNNNLPVQIGTPVQTDAKGGFLIQHAPVGFFKLMADGTTVTGTKSYPTLEYDLVTIAGQNNTVGTPIYLQALDSVNKVCVDATHGGTLTLPQVPGFALTILPGSATFAGGSRSGCVSVTPVNADKVPMAPGFGQQPRFIVTIQPVGTTFNPPAPITIPNVDGLKPRAVTEFYSYDHDLGMFTAIGTGTVSSDGSVIASNAGVGVLKAGWHCGGDPNSTGTAATCAECNTCQGDGCMADDSQTPEDKCKICKGGTSVHNDKLDQPGVQSTYSLGQVSKIIQGINNALADLKITDEVELPEFAGELELTTATVCCDGTVDGGTKKSVKGSLKSDFASGKFRPQFPPYTGNYEFTFLGQTFGAAYGIELQGSVSASASLQAETLCQEDTEWSGAVTGEITVSDDLFAEVLNPLFDDCGTDHKQACTLLSITGGATTGIALKAVVKAKEIDIGELDWSGLKIGYTAKAFEGTAVEYSYTGSLIVFSDVALGTAFTIPLPSLGK
jgi:hypothetical protein